MTFEQMRSALRLDPACECCPHILDRDLDRDKFLRDVWDMCPVSGCLWRCCIYCLPQYETRRRNAKAAAKA